MEKFQLRAGEDFIRLGQVLKAARTGFKSSRIRGVRCGGKRGYTGRSGQCER